MRAQPPAEIHGFADVQRPPLTIEQRVHAGRSRRLDTNPVADPAPRQFAIFDDERLLDESACELGGRMVNAEGKTGMKDVWGKRSNWVDYSGDVEGETIGIAMFDAPSNPRHPTYWHARDYGLFALDPFGQQAFDPAQPESHWELDTGKSLRFRWRVIIHPGDAAAAHIAELYEKWSQEKP